MDQVHVVRHKVLVEGRSQRAVARELGLARVTVRKYLDQAVAVRRPERAPRAGRSGTPSGRGCEALLAESVQWTGGKQRLTATRLHALLVAEGHRVGVTMVKAAVAEWKRQRREVFVPLTYRPGDLAEVDFFEVLVDLDGVRRKAWLFLMRLMYSGRDFAWIYERQDQISFLDGHVRAFAHFEGVPARVAYDNLRAVVVRILVGGARTLTPRFTALASHYLLEACFCRPGEGHDKGGVESRGKAVRQQALVPIPSGPTLAGINAALLAQMDARLDTTRDAAGQTIRARFADEARLFRPAAGAVCGGGHDARDRVAPVVGATRRRVLLGAVSVGRARPGRAHGGDDGDDHRPRGDPHRPSASTLRAAIDRLPALPRGAGAQAAGGAAGPAGPAPRSRARRFRPCGRSCTRRMGRATPRGSSPRCSASSTPSARPASCPP